MTLHGQCMEDHRQAIHYVADLSEHSHAAGPALDMLTESTQCNKFGAAVRLWASIYLVLVYWALQVLVEPRERIERPVAEEALVCRPIPRAVRHPCHRGRGRLGAAERAREQARRVRDVVVRVRAND